MRRVPRVSTVALVLGAVVVAWALTSWWRDGRPGHSFTHEYALVCAVAVAVGEVVRSSLGVRESAPISMAAALALAMSPVTDRAGHMLSASGVILLVGGALAVGGVVRVLGGRDVSASAMTTRLIGVTATVALSHGVTVGGSSLLEWSQDSDVPKWALASGMVGAATAGVLVELAGRTLLQAQALHAPLRASVRDAVGISGALGIAIIASAPLIVLARPAVGPMAVPLYLCPVGLAQIGIRRYSAVRQTYRQTIGALSRLTEVTGHTAPGHAERVADLSVAVGRDLGLSAGELDDLEYAALLHDLGQVALRVPIPGGATVLVTPPDQRQIAEDGAEIVRRTGVLERVAVLMEGQTTPYRQVREFGHALPRAARVLKVVNAYDDLTGEGADARLRAAAMERIHLGLGYEYDPEVVQSLARVLARRSTGIRPEPDDGAHLVG